MNANPSAFPALTKRPTLLRLCAAATLASCWLLAGCTSLKTKPAEGVDLSGQWKLNESLSDDPRALLRQQRQASRPAGAGRGGMRGGYGFPGGGRGMRGRAHGSGTGGGGGGGGTNNDYLARPTEISIGQMPQRLHMVEDGTPTDFVYGEKVAVSVASGLTERTSGWKSHKFVIQYAAKEGSAAATRTYETAASGQQLIVTTKITGGRAPLELHSTYEREPTPPAS